MSSLILAVIMVEFGWIIWYAMLLTTAKQEATRVRVQQRQTMRRLLETESLLYALMDSVEANAHIEARLRKEDNEQAYQNRHEGIRK